ncbi:unnamed protein product [Chrysoparadoxa australica]
MGNQVMKVIGSAEGPTRAFILLLGNKTVLEIMEMKRAFDKMDCCPGLDIAQLEHVLRHACLPNECNAADGARFIMDTFDTLHNSRVDINEVLAAAVLASKANILSKIRALFDLFDFNHDASLNKWEAVMMLHSVLLACCKVTSGKEPPIEQLEAAAEGMFSNADVVKDGRVTYPEWLAFCRGNQDVHRIARSMDVVKGPPGTKGGGEGGKRGSRMPGQPGEAKKGGLRAGSGRDGVRAKGGVGAGKRQRVLGLLGKEPERPRGHSSASASKAKYRRASVMWLKDTFNELDADGSGYLDSQEWSLHCKASGIGRHGEATFDVMDRNRDGKISIAEVLGELYPFANDVDINSMMDWVTKQPVQKKATRNLNQAERDEMITLFNMYDKDGNGSLSIEELCGSLSGGSPSDGTGLMPADVLKMFQEAGKGKDDTINADEFASLFIHFISGDIGITQLMCHEYVSDDIQVGRLM